MGEPQEEAQEDELTLEEFIALKLKEGKHKQNKEGIKRILEMYQENLEWKREKDKRLMKNEAAKSYRLEKKKKGICAYCQRKAVEGRTRCWTHIIEHKKYNEERDRKRKEKEMKSG
jgi:hypothetical protein